MERLKEDVAKLQLAVEELKEAAVEHRVRLENGSAVFGKQDARLCAVENRITPKPASVTRIASITFGVFIVLSSALWALSTMLSDRPTTSQLRSVIGEHEKNGHEQTRSDIREIRSSINEQERLLKDVVSEQAEIKRVQADNVKKLDAALKGRRR